MFKFQRKFKVFGKFTAKQPGIFKHQHPYLFLAGQTLEFEGIAFEFKSSPDGSGLGAFFKANCPTCDSEITGHVWAGLDDWEQVKGAVTNFQTRSCRDCQFVIDDTIEALEEEIAEHERQLEDIQRILHESGMPFQGDLEIWDNGKLNFEQFLWVDGKWIPLWMYIQTAFYPDLVKINELKNALGVSASAVGNLIGLTPIHVMRPSKLKHLQTELQRLRDHQNIMETHQRTTAPVTSF